MITKGFPATGSLLYIPFLINQNNEDHIWLPDLANMVEMFVQMAKIGDL